MLNASSVFFGYDEVSITNSQGKTFPITQFVEEIAFVEDMFSNVMRGEMILVDDVSIPTAIDFRGCEKLEFVLIDQVENKRLKLEFFVYAISTKAKAGNSGEVLQMNFCSYEQIVNEKRIISSAFSGKNSDSVIKVFRQLNSPKILEVEDTDGFFKYAIPSFSPLKTINWYAGRSTNNNGSMFTFFEDRDGFKFRCVESLMKRDTKCSYHYSPSNRSLAKDNSNIINYEVVEVTDFLRAQDYLASTLFTTDLIRKKVERLEYNVFEKNPPVMNRELLFSKKNGFGDDLFQTGNEFMVKHETMKVHSETQDYVYPTIQHKMARFKLLNGIKVRFLAFGNPLLRPGDTVEMTFMKPGIPTETNKTEMIDTLMSGKYLVSAIRNVLGHNRNHQSIEVVKDSR